MSGRKLVIRMPGALPTKNDNYLCRAFELESLSNSSEPIFVTAFRAVDAEASRAHHMLLYGCKNPIRKDQIFDCQHHGVSCNFPTNIASARPIFS